MPLLGKSENTKLWPQFKRWIGEMILFISFPLFFPFLSLATWLQHKKGCCTSFRIYLSSWGTSGAGARGKGRDGGSHGLFFCCHVLFVSACWSRQGSTVLCFIATTSSNCWNLELFGSAKRRTLRLASHGDPPAIELRPGLLSQGTAPIMSKLFCCRRILITSAICLARSRRNWLSRK